MSLTIIFAIALAFSMAIIDWRERAIPLGAIVLFALPSFFVGFNKLLDSQWWLHLTILALPLLIAICGMTLKYRQAVIGMGDGLMLFLGALWLEPCQLPHLLILSGIMGALLAMICKEKEIPFIPGLIISWGVLITLDGQSVKRYIKVMSDYLIEYIGAFWSTALAAK